MDVKGGAVRAVFGLTTADEFEDMDANGEHGLALTLIAMATEVLDHRSRDALMQRVGELVDQYQAREVPARYV